MHALGTQPTASATSATSSAGKQRGARVAQVDLARKLTEAIWHMLTTNQPFDPAAAGGATLRLTA